MCSNYKFLVIFLFVFILIFFGNHIGIKGWHNYFPVILFYFILSSIKKSSIRSVCLTIFLLISLISIIVRYLYGSVSKNMILAALGVDLKASIGLLEQVPAYDYILLSMLILLIAYFSYTMKSIKLNKIYYISICAMIFYSLSQPIIRGVHDWGWRFFINNIYYDKTFLAQDYIDRYKIFFGDVIAASFIEISSIDDAKKYKIVKHEKYPDFVYKNGDGEQNIVFIIGESSNVLRYSAYSYGRPTTPNLKRWHDDGSWCALENVHSPASQTRVSVPMYVSFSDPENGNYLFDYKNIIEMAKANNYATYWLDAQDGQGLWDKPFGFVEKYADIYASPDLNNTSFKITEGKDDTLINPVEFYFKKAQGPSIFFIHLFGNHLPYDMSINNDDNGTDFDMYDKSIHHVDKIISEIKVLADKNLKNYQMVYVPDHGEEVGKGHGFPSKSNEMYLIPFLSNDNNSCKYMENFRGEDGKISSSDTKYLILHLLGYDISAEKIKYEKLNEYKVKDYQERIVDFRKLEPVLLED